MFASDSAGRYPATQAAWRGFPVDLREDQLLIGGWQVMQRWETPLMHVLAREVTASHGSILEVGFGMGIAAQAILQSGCAQYTVIEAHPDVAAAARVWGASQSAPVTVLEGFWEDIVPHLTDQFDGVLFDTYPLTPADRSRNHFPFIPHVPGLLRPNGIFTLYSDETLDFRVEHLKLLLHHFDEVRLIPVRGLSPPADCEYWQSDTMVIPVATRHRPTTEVPSLHSCQNKGDTRA